MILLRVILAPLLGCLSSPKAKSSRSANGEGAKPKALATDSNQLTSSQLAPLADETNSKAAGELIKLLIPIES